MAGDGVNDAPAAAQADVEFAMITGADVDVEGAGITLVKVNSNGIVKARGLSQAAVRNICQNLFIAFIYNTAGVPITSGVLYPFSGLLIGPIFTACANSVTSLSVILDAWRLRTINI